MYAKYNTLGNVNQRAASQYPSATANIDMNNQTIKAQKDANLSHLTDNFFKANNTDKDASANIIPENRYSTSSNTKNGMVNPTHSEVIVTIYLSGDILARINLVVALIV
jgi:hypothetical protein